MSPQAAAPAAGVKALVAERRELEDRKKDLERDLRKVKTRIAELRPELLDAFAEIGVRSLQDAESGKTVFMRRDIRVKSVHEDRSSACVALKAVGLGGYVAESFNLNSVGGYFRDLIKAREADGSPVTDPNDVLPAKLRGEIELTNDYDIRVNAD